MAQKDRCASCGAFLSSREKNCPDCGAPNPHYRPEDAHSPGGDGEKPRTIAQLQAYCAARGMPLERMRFFIGVDYREPRAFGIYRDGSVFVVYKNKSDGSRAIRYRGPDEAYAVGALYDKLMAEHEKRSHLRMTRYPANPTGPSSDRTVGSGILNGLKSFFWRIRFHLLLLAVIVVISAVSGRIKHRNDGYYRVGDNLFYRYGSSWFMDSITDDWYEIDGFPYSDYQEYYQGNTYDSDWGGSSFTDSQVWDALQSSDSDSDGSWDYSGWDAGDTDWDSDW